MFRMKALRMAASLLIVHLNLAGQTVKGILTDENSKAIAWATVSLLRSSDSLLLLEQATDSSGNFIIPLAQPGNYLLRFSAIGFQTLHHSIQFTHQSLDLGTLVMSTDPALMNAVVVSGARPVFQRQADRLVVNVSGSQFFRTASNGMEVLRRIPGLEVNYDGTLTLSGRITPAVFIDGKPVPMSSEELRQFLQTLTPEMIASIELVNNPSGRYDGEHKGIIDIKLKRDQALGWRGTLSSSLQLNNYAYNENSLLLTYKNRATAFTLRGGYTGGSRIYRYEAYQQLANTNWMRTKNAVATRNNTYNVNLGIEHSPGKDHRLELLLRTTQNQRDLDAFGTLHTTDASTKNLVSLVGTDNISSPTQRSYAASLNYTGKFGKSQLTWLNNILELRTRQQEDIHSSDLVDPELLLYWKTKLKNDVSIKSTQVDFSTGAGKSKWGAGAKFAYSNTHNDARYDTLNTNAQFVIDEGRTHLFRYREYISAAYLSWEASGGKFTYTTSLRVENTRTIADAPKIQTTTKRAFWHWLPAASISFAVNDQNQLQLSFSRRITRPVFSDLYPFRIYNSPLNYFTGNPYLTPAVTTSVNFTWTYKNMNAGINIGRESDPLGRYPRYDPVSNVLEYLGKNFDYRSFANLELSVPIVVTKWWRMNNTVGAYYMKENIPYFEYNFSVPVKYVMVNGSQVFSLPGKLTMDLVYYYKSPNGNSLYTSRYNSNIDIGMQKSWFGGKLNSKLSVHDILDTYKIVFTFREKQLINNRLSHWPGMRRVALTLSYNFGKSTYKAKQQNRNEEESRAL